MGIFSYLVAALLGAAIMAQLIALNQRPAAPPAAPGGDGARVSATA